MRVKSLMSAPAMKLSGLPLRSTTARISSSASDLVEDPLELRDHALAQGVHLLAGHVEREDEDAVVVPLPREGQARRSSLEDHREAHAALRADGEQAELRAPPLQLVRQGGGDAGPGRAERVAEGDRAARTR